MRPRMLITVLVSVAALILGIGIPAFALTLKPATELVEGTVVSVAPEQNSVLVHSVAGARELRGLTIVVRVPLGQRVKNSYGDEDLGFLLPGQPISVRVRAASLEAQRIAVVDPAWTVTGPSASPGP